MKLYFYKLDKEGFNRKPKGITVEAREVIEKPKAYYPTNGGNFPGWMCFVKKGDIGKIVGYDTNLIVLTEPNFEYVKDKFRELAESNVKLTKERLAEHENILRVINECEEINDEDSTDI